MPYYHRETLAATGLVFGGKASRFRDEFLNESLLLSLNDARDVIESWRIDHNGGRPHSSLAGLALTKYVEHMGRALIAIGP